MSCQLRVWGHHRQVLGCGAPNWSHISTHCSRPPHSGLRIARGAACHYMWYIGHMRRSSGSNGQVRRCRCVQFVSAHFRRCPHSREDGNKGEVENDKANGKGKVRLGCAAAVQFLRTRRWEALITICLEEQGMKHKRLGGRLWGDVCREWWDNFAKTCVHGKSDGCPGGT